MVSIVWLILSLFKVCAFTWLPVLIDSGLLTLLILILDFTIAEDEFGTNALPSMGVFMFAIYKYFFCLTLPDWSVLLSTLPASVILLLPGGFTALNLLYNHSGFAMVPQWAVITGIVLDVVKLILITIIIIVVRKKD